MFPNYHDFRVEFVNDRTYMALVSALRMVIMSMFVFHMAVFPVSTVLKDKCYSISFCIDTYQRRVITKPKVFIGIHSLFIMTVIMSTSFLVVIVAMPMPMITVQNEFARKG